MLYFDTKLRTSKEASAVIKLQKIIYAVPECHTCPVKMLCLLSSKSDRYLTNLFNAFVKEALISPNLVTHNTLLSLFYRQSFN